jgi:glycosyltransferase involved in cell wall biosynthesis
MDQHYRHCLEGRQQLEKLVGKFDYYIADSDFNVQELIKLGCSPASVMPIVVDLKVRGVRKVYRSKTPKKFIFIGRVAPNKKHEDIILIFNYYYSYIDPASELYLVGNYQDYMPYYNKLKNLVDSLPSRSNIHFTGKVSDGELDYHYKTADAFICMSEHEGFCVPILESMSYGVVTFAYDSGAIRTTMGDSGILITEKMHEEIAELISYVLDNEQLSQSIIDRQYNWLTHFSREKSIQRLSAIIDKMRYA